MEDQNPGLGSTAPTPVSPAEVLIVGLLSFLVAVVATMADHWPGPVAHDEFSLLLGGETLALGRFANPAHPRPEFLETFHVLQTPAYASKYFPGHSLFLALGIVLGGGARLGQWLAFASMGAALAWSLRGWVPRSVAWGAAACAVLVVADTPWASGYWGATVAVTGSALVLGAYPRVVRDGGVRASVALGLGAALLMLTRPWEGLWVCLPVAVTVTAWMLGDAARRRTRMMRVGIPVVVVLAAGAGLLSMHNRATTGSWHQPAYVAYERTGSGAPPFVWQSAHPVPADARVTERERAVADMDAYTRLRTEPVRALRSRVTSAIRFYGGPFVVIALLLLAAAAPRRRSLLLPACSLVAGVAAVAVSSYYTPNYVAPALPALLVLVASGAAALRATAWWRWRLAQGITVCVLLIAATAMVRTSRSEATARDPRYWVNRRAAVERQLNATPGRHVVFVRYAASYAARYEWVQNPADLAGARTLWVHDLGDSANAQFMAREPGRRAWRLELDSPSGPVPHLTACAPCDPHLLPDD